VDFVNTIIVTVVGIMLKIFNYKDKNYNKSICKITSLDNQMRKIGMINFKLLNNNKITFSQLFKNKLRFKDLYKFKEP
jgi:flagellar motor component MotA